MVYTLFFLGATVVLNWYYLLPQIESNDISAQISASGSVTFSDPPPQFTKEQVDNVLRDVQEQSALLSMLEQEIGKNKEYLVKVCFSSGVSFQARKTFLIAFSLSLSPSLLGGQGERFLLGSSGSRWGTHFWPRSIAKCMGGEFLLTDFKPPFVQNWVLSRSSSLHGSFLPNCFDYSTSIRTFSAHVNLGNNLKSNINTRKKKFCIWIVPVQYNIILFSYMKIQKAKGIKLTAESKMQNYRKTHIFTSFFS